MFITAKTLGDGQKTVVLNTHYVELIDTGGIVHMAGSVRRYKVGVDTIQRLIEEQYSEEAPVGTQHFTKQIARDVAGIDGEQARQVKEYIKRSELSMGDGNRPYGYD